MWVSQKKNIKFLFDIISFLFIEHTISVDFDNRNLEAAPNELDELV